MSGSQRAGATPRCRHAPARRLFALALCVLTCVEVASAAEDRESRRPLEPQQLLLGIVVGGQEVAVAEVPFDGREFLVPLESFLAYCDCEVIEGREGLDVITPLGTGRLERVDLATVDGQRYLRESGLVNRLAIRVSYDTGRLALILDIPWHGRAFSRRASESLERLPIDAAPPAASLSGASVRVRHSRFARQRATEGSMGLTGRAAGGRWQLRYDDAFGDGLVSEYGWIRSLGDNALMLLGHQRVSLHPLLGGIELTGAQAAWTNAPMAIFNAASDPAELLPRQLRSTTTIRGLGVAAGTAILRVNDEPVAAQVVGLDGLYEFRDVPVRASYTNRIEVLVYDRQNPSAPVAIHDHSRSASEYVLPRGALVMQGGAGTSGNVFQSEATGPAAGFYQARYGLSDRVTLEVAAQGQSGRREAMLGGVAQLGRRVVSSFGLAHKGGRLAWMADGEAVAGDWRLTVSSRGTQAAQGIGAAPRQWDHQLDASRRFAGGNLEIAVVGRLRRGFTRDVGFVLPALMWRPASSFLLRARPDLEGSYRLDMSWIPARSWRIGVSRAQRVNTVDVSHSLGRGLRGSLLAELADSGGHRQAAVVTWFGEGRWLPSIAAGPLLTNGKLGGLLRAQVQVVPGVLLGLHYESRSLIGRADSVAGHRVSMTLTSNVMFAGRRVVSGSRYGMRARTGGIAGKLRVATGYATPPGSLAGVGLRIGGRIVAHTEADGSYYIPNLAAGTYRLRVDPAGLPIELSPARSRLVVAVAEGAVTRADFLLRVEFGLAGRLRIAGVPVAGIDVELIDEGGQVVATGTTDGFGLYRLDAVPRGRYEVRVAARTAAVVDGVWSRRVATVDDDFLFGQNLDLRVSPAGAEALRSHPDFAGLGSGDGDQPAIATTEVSRDLSAAAAAPTARLAALFARAALPTLLPVGSPPPRFELLAPRQPVRAPLLRGQ